MMCDNCGKQLSKCGLGFFCLKGEGGCGARYCLINYFGHFKLVTVREGRA